MPRIARSPRPARARARAVRRLELADHGRYGRGLKRTVVAILAGLALICVAAVIDVTLLGGTGAPTRGPRDCLTIQELRTVRPLRRLVPTDEGEAHVRRLLEGPTPQRRAKR